MTRRFTHSEAESLLPEVERLIREAVRQKQVYETASEAISDLTERAAQYGGILVDRGVAIENRAARDRSGERLKAVLQEIQQVGCVVKDLDVGLIDFPTLYHGSEVYLCWKVGEPSIRFWHGVDESFAGRKPIDDEFLRNHKGELEQ
ncbi:MAG: DUF2203 domain-containing protein [Bryobacteraceae bacterium]